MADLGFIVTVQPDEGEKFTVTTDQRDVAAWELEPFGGMVAEYPRKLFTFCRYIAWHQQKRTGKTRDNFQKWSDKIKWCDIEELEPEDGAGDPGRPAPPAGS